jgi:ATP-dependent Clp protease ATP-binding subunit ClpC
VKNEYEAEFAHSIDKQFPAPGMTERTKRIFLRAMTASQEQGLPTSTVHVLLSILDNRDAYAVLILRKLGVDIDLLANAARAVILEKQKAAGKAVEKSSDAPFGQAKPAPRGNAAVEGEWFAERKTPRRSTAMERLAAFGIDMTERVLRGKVDPVIGRQREIELVTQVLSRRSKNNPVLVGEPGVGKSAIIEGLATLIVQEKVPSQLIGKTIFSLDVPGMLAGTKYRGEFEERIKDVIEAVMADANIILFIDEIHTIVGAGASSENSMDAANILKPMLARGDLQVVGATTIEEYRKYIEKDSALERRFTPVWVEEPTAEQTTEILKGLRARYDQHHGVAISDEAIESAVALSSR